MLRVLLTRKLPEKFAASLRSQLNDKVELICWQSETEPISRDFLLEQAPHLNGILCLLSDKIDQEFLGQVRPVDFKCVSTMSVGVDHVDLAECGRLGIRVGYTPGVLTNATADLAMALLLATARRLAEAATAAKDGSWGTWSPFWMCGRGISGSTVGLVGLGRIGQAIAKRLSGFSPGRLIYCGGGRKSAELEASLGCQRVEFDALLQQSDFVIVCCPGNEETRNLFNKRAFSLMRPNAALVNISRGIVVNQADLRHALASGEIGAAGLDVTDPEPLPVDDPLLRMPNCLVLPHIGSADQETRETMAQMAVDNLVAGLRGGDMPAEFKV